jgi:hypothetical protein
LIFSIRFDLPAIIGIGGTLANGTTLIERIQRLKNLEQQETDNTFNLLKNNMIIIGRLKIRERLNLTKLKALEKAGWVVGNSSALLEKIGQFMDIGAIIGGSVYSAKTAALNVANGLEDLACRDYKCLTLDCLACFCDVTAAGVAFLPKTNRTGAVFAGCTATSKFYRTLRGKCKDMSGLFGCK